MFLQQHQIDPYFEKQILSFKNYFLWFFRFSLFISSQWHQLQNLCIPINKISSPRLVINHNPDTQKAKKHCQYAELWNMECAWHFMKNNGYSVPVFQFIQSAIPPTKQPPVVIIHNTTISLLVVARKCIIYDTATYSVPTSFVRHYH